MDSNIVCHYWNFPKFHNVLYCSLLTYCRNICTNTRRHSKSYSKSISTFQKFPKMEILENPGGVPNLKHISRWVQHNFLSRSFRIKTENTIVESVKSLENISESCWIKSIFETYWICLNSVGWEWNLGMYGR